MLHRVDTLTPALLDHIANSLLEQGFVVLPSFAAEALAEQLRLEATTSKPAFWTPAGTGRERYRTHRLNTAIRSDSTRWLGESSDVDRSWLALTDELRLGLNERLFLGLYDHECHYAKYAPGAFYTIHMDAFAGSRNRILSSVYYLNRDWPTAAGGELLLYAEDGKQVLETIFPHFNTLVLFLSERFPHEVRPANLPRLSIAGWFRVRE